jgi:hypothetical protein
MTMTMTLGEALTADNDSVAFPKDQSIQQGYDKANTKLKTERKKVGGGALNAQERNGDLKKALFKALDIALEDILGQAWSSWQELSQYADSAKDEINTVTLSDHTIKSSHQPSVDIIVDGVSLHTFDFAVLAELKVEGVELVVQGGAITKIRLGDLELGGSVKLDNSELLKKDVAKVTIADELLLANPIPLRRPDAETK